MKNIIIKSISSHRYLFDFENYTKKEEITKKIIMPFALVINTLLFLVASVFLIVEYGLSFVFRFFIHIQAKLFQKKMQAIEERQKYYTFFSVLIGIVFMPIILVFYISMMLKSLTKLGIKKIIYALDFAGNIASDQIIILDDTTFKPHQTMQNLFKGVHQNQAIGDAIETYFENVSQEDNQNN